MIGRPPGRFRDNTRKAQSSKVQFVNEEIDHADRIVLRHVVFQAIREQCRLTPILALNETLHHDPRLIRSTLSDQSVSTQAGPKADIGARRRHVRFRCQSGRQRAENGHRCPEVRFRGQNGRRFRRRECSEIAIFDAEGHTMDITSAIAVAEENDVVASRAKAVKGRD